MHNDFIFIQYFNVTGCGMKGKQSVWKKTPNIHNHRSMISTISNTYVLKCIVTYWTNSNSYQLCLRHRKVCHCSGQCGEQGLFWYPTSCSNSIVRKAKGCILQSYYPCRFSWLSIFTSLMLLELLLLLMLLLLLTSLCWECS